MAIIYIFNCGLIRGVWRYFVYFIGGLHLGASNSDVFCTCLVITESTRGIICVVYSNEMTGTSLVNTV